MPAGYISGEVFALTSSGKIDRYVYPHTVSHAEPAADAGYLWDVADLAGVFKDTVMGEGYESHASKQAWS